MTSTNSNPFELQTSLTDQKPSDPVSDIHDQETDHETNGPNINGTTAMITSSAVTSSDESAISETVPMTNGINTTTSTCLTLPPGDPVPFGSSQVPLPGSGLPPGDPVPIGHSSGDVTGVTTTVGPSETINNNTVTDSTVTVTTTVNGVNNNVIDNINIVPSDGNIITDTTVTAAAEATVVTVTDPVNSTQVKSEVPEVPTTVDQLLVPDPSRPTPPDAVCYKAFVGGLGANTTSESLRKFFADKHGSENVESGIVMEFLDRRTNTTRSRGFGFIIFSNKQTLDLVLDGSIPRSFDIDGKTVEVKRIEDGRGNVDIRTEIESRKIFCGGLHPQVDEQMLKSFFIGVMRSTESHLTPTIHDPENSVSDIKIMHDAIANRSRCFGYITFRDSDCVIRACQNADKNYLLEKWIDVKPSLSGKGSFGFPNGVNIYKGGGKGAGSTTVQYGKGPSGQLIGPPPGVTVTPIVGHGQYQHHHVTTTTAAGPQYHQYGPQYSQYGHAATAAGQYPGYQYYHHQTVPTTHAQSPQYASVPQYQYTTTAAHPHYATAVQHQHAAVQYPAHHTVAAAAAPQYSVHPAYAQTPGTTITYAPAQTAVAAAPGPPTTAAAATAQAAAPVTTTAQATAVTQTATAQPTTATTAATHQYYIDPTTGQAVAIQSPATATTATTTQATSDASAAAYHQAYAAYHAAAQAQAQAQVAAQQVQVQQAQTVGTVDAAAYAAAYQRPAPY